MDLYFLEYRDPLFGIIIFFVLLFAITLVSYLHNTYKKNEDSKHLDSFLDQFKTSSTQIDSLMGSGGFSQQFWLVLADAFNKNGDYAKAVEIYSELIKTSQSSKEIMFLLGKTLFMAGFIQRSKKIFLELLKKSPRNTQALSYLMLVYEQSKDFNSALEILTPLSELKSDISSEEMYLKTHIILNEPSLNKEQKIEKLLELYRKTRKLNYDIFEYLFRVAPNVAWEHLDVSRAMSIVDILWRVEAKDLNFDIISQSSFLTELYSAKKYIDEAKSSAIFEFNLLINSNEKANATLGFEYICSNCSHKQPFSFARCPSCHSLEGMVVDMLVVKDYSRGLFEESNSFL